MDGRRHVQRPAIYSNRYLMRVGCWIMPRLRFTAMRSTLVLIKHDKIICLTIIDTGWQECAHGSAEQSTASSVGPVLSRTRESLSYPHSQQPALRQSPQGARVRAQATTASEQPGSPRIQMYDSGRKTATRSRHAAYLLSAPTTKTTTATHPNILHHTVRGQDRKTKAAVLLSLSLRLSPLRLPQKGTLSLLALRLLLNHRRRRKGQQLWGATGKRAQAGDSGVRTWEVGAV
jgi:hypothetical protein